MTDKTMTLEPCPFCGGDAETYVYFGGKNGVRCRQSGSKCRVGPAILGDDCVALWNTRHLSQPAERGEAVEVSVLREQLKGIADTSCRNCDGSGIFYGNVALCSCVLHKIAPPPAAGVPDAFEPIPECTRAPTHELWDAYQAFNYAYRGMNTQQALRAAINGVLANRARIYAELSATPSPTIDVAAVREVCHVLREITINGHAPFTAQADKLARAIGDAK